MPYVNEDVSDIINMEEKKQILKEAHQEDIIKLFKNGTYGGYKPPKHNADPLDQAVTVAITSKEKDYIGNELKEIRKSGGRTTVSAFCRKRTIIDLDVISWSARATRGLKVLNGKDWNKRSLLSKKKTALKRLSKVAYDDNEGKKLYQKRIEELDTRLKLIEKPDEKRTYRVKIRFTYNEANTIRWRASRLSLTVADYIRFILFDYMPYSKDDKNMSVNYRRRFYVSIIEVGKCGWGNMPELTSPKNEMKYLNEIAELKQKITRLEAALTPRQRRDFSQNANPQL